MRQRVTIHHVGLHESSSRIDMCGAYLYEVSFLNIIMVAGKQFKRINENIYSYLL